jgi:hypothetical protein
MDGPNGVWIALPEYQPTCDHPRPFQYEPKSDPVALATKKRKDDERAERQKTWLSRALKPTLMAIWDSAAEKLEWDRG